MGSGLKCAGDSCARQTTSHISTANKFSLDSSAFHFAFLSRVTVLHTDCLQGQSITQDSNFLSRQSFSVGLSQRTKTVANSRFASAGFHHRWTNLYFCFGSRLGRQDFVLSPSRLQSGKTLAGTTDNIELTNMNINFKRLDHIQICIPTGQENTARHFYTDIIGLKEIPKPKELIKNGGLWYQLADIQFHIGTENEINKSKRHPAFEVTDILAARQHLEKNGVTIKEEIQVTGQMRFSFIDPFGNRIELLQKTADT